MTTPTTTTASAAAFIADNVLYLGVPAPDHEEQPHQKGSLEEASLQAYLSLEPDVDHRRIVSVSFQMGRSFSRTDDDRLLMHLHFRPIVVQKIRLDRPRTNTNTTGA